MGRGPSAGQSDGSVRSVRSTADAKRLRGCEEIEWSFAADPSSFTAPTHPNRPAVPATQDDARTRSDSALSTQHSALEAGVHSPLHESLPLPAALHRSR